MLVGLSGHINYSFNCDRVGLETICCEVAFPNKEFHLVDIQVDMMLLKSLKHSDKV